VLQTAPQRFSQWFLIIMAVLIPSAFAQNTPARAPNTCKEFMLVGKLNYGQGNFEAAYVAFSNCVALQPNNIEALYSLGRTEIRQRLFSAAIEHLKKCVTVDAKYWRCYVALSDAYVDQYTTSSDRKSLVGLLDEGLKVLDDAERATANNNEGRAAVWNQRGVIYRYKGNTEKAIESFRKSLTFAPGSATVLFNLGNLYLGINKVDDAIDSLKKAVNVLPRDAQLRATLSKAYRAKGTATLGEAMDQATQAYNLCGATKCRSAFVVGQYGIMLYTTKSMNNAKTLLETATKLDGTGAFHENYYYLGRTYLDLGQAKSARNALSKAVIIQGGDPLYWYWLGQANEAAGEKEDACKNYAQALKVSGGDYKEAQRASAALRCPASNGSK
jgi:tetratricopeptide (TPR) repeat protein